MDAWRVHGLSVPGYRHRRDGVPCQDAWLHTSSGRGQVLAVADGAGSRPRSDEGSQLAVELAVKHFAQWASSGGPGDPRAVKALLRAAFREVRQEFLRAVGVDAGDFASTLTVVVIAPRWLGHLSVGDGFVVLRSGEEGGAPMFHVLPQPEAPGEYGNETVFVTSDNAEERAHAECVLDPEVTGVLLSTDGLAQAALSLRPRVPNESFVSAVLGSLDRPGPDPERDTKSLADLLSSDRLTALNADDKTLLRAVRA
ncbi:PP2C family serine/threonine-protein phosphatase [Streptomyces sp. NPDC051940]|uniref:PP2C family serine/threonine-protein phosphatase n=1 Tax=Streptomyces sp. NPDC051940 TaxID=3155675 RepID=UPI0034155C30